MPFDPLYAATRSLMLMTTYECQLRCSYCLVRRGPRRMDEETARRAADLLVASSAPRLLLNFFGGEPLLAWDLVRGVAAYARRRAGGRPLRLNLTTNGLLLDDEVLAFLRDNDGFVHLSLDGDPAARFGAPSRAAAREAEEALRRLARSGVPHHVNAVVTPARAGSFDEDLLALERLGARRIQLGYQVGTDWDAQAVRRLLESLDRYEAAGSAELVNRSSDSEPVMLSREPIVDVDGGLYWDGAIFLESALPRAREALRLGRLGEAPSLDALRAGPEEPLRRLMAVYPPSSAGGRLILGNVKVGLALKSRWHGRAGPAEDPAMRRGVVDAGLAEQSRFLSRRLPWLDRVFLFLRGGCDLDCSFCRAKPAEPPQTLAEVEAFLSGNAAARRRRLALVGNEPMAHPELAAIARACRRRGFREVEVMTSGVRLAGAAAGLARAGVTSYAVALHGSRPEVHDAVTRRPGSFEAAVRGIAAARAAGARVYVHATACRANLGDLPALERRARAEGWPFSIHPVRPKDPAGMNEPYERLAPGYGELRRELAGRVSSLTGFPACVARAVQGSASCGGEQVADSMKLYLLHQAFVKPESCGGCPDAGRCVGTFAEHLRERPREAEELCPA